MTILISKRYSLSKQKRSIDNFYGFIQIKPSIFIDFMDFASLLKSLLKCRQKNLSRSMQVHLQESVICNDDSLTFDLTSFFKEF